MLGFIWYISSFYSSSLTSCKIINEKIQIRFILQRFYNCWKWILITILNK